MLKQRREAGEQVAETLFAAEAAIDAAIAKIAALAGAIPTARAQAGLSALFGQDAVERVADTLSALTQARRGIVETHKELAVVQKQVGLGAVAYGGDVIKPTTGLDVDARPALRAVSDKAAA